MSNINTSKIAMESTTQISSKEIDENSVEDAIAISLADVYLGNEVNEEQNSSTYVINHEYLTSDLDSPAYQKVETLDLDAAWRRTNNEVSLPEVHGSIRIREDFSLLQKIFAYIGPGSLVAVGYMDPGNWSTDIAGGSAFGYTLLFVVLVSSIFAMFLQALAAKCGLATNRDLAQCCRDAYHPKLVPFLWIITEIAICATDLSEMIGSAVALNLLFNIPVVAGVFITSVDVFIVLFTQGKSFRIVEVLVTSLIMMITICFAIQIGISNPGAIDVLSGYLPSKELVASREILLVAIGIVGATVMPHNLFLHSSIVLTRDCGRDDIRIAEAIKFNVCDSTFSLFVALFVNSSILIVSAATFYKNGYDNIATLEDAYTLLDPLLGTSVASILFATALLASGLNATLTGTLTGQIVMEGFMTWKLSPFYRRLLTRGMAIIPAAAISGAYGNNPTAINDMLIYSQVILSFALPFAIFPLIFITSDKKKMGVHVNSWYVTLFAYLIGFLIIILNILFLIG